MPAKNVIRQYSENMYLHVFNQGVEKRKIFIDEDDYLVFLNYLSLYLSDPTVISQNHPKLRTNLKKSNLYGQVKLLGYCLLPNHFHLLLYQADKEATSKLMKQLTNAYTQYFNTKYKRVGALMQGKYKAVAINEIYNLIYLSRFIHQDPLKVNFVLNALRNYPWSSYRQYVGLQNLDFLDKHTLADFFKTQFPDLSYERFVEESKESSLTEELKLDT